MNVGSPMKPGVRDINKQENCSNYGIFPMMYSLMLASIWSCLCLHRTENNFNLQRMLPSEDQSSYTKLELSHTKGVINIGCFSLLLYSDIKCCDLPALLWGMILLPLYGLNAQSRVFRNWQSATTKCFIWFGRTFITSHPEYSFIPLKQFTLSVLW